MDSGRLPHALLLSGPEGCGKLPVARALAQYIHCQHRHDGDSCGVCPSCVQHAAFGHADMHYVYPVVKSKTKGVYVSADNIAEWQRFLQEYPYAGWRNWLEISEAGNSRPSIHVEESSEIVRRMNMTNYAAAYKIVLMWLPEKLEPAAANKLLKIIEEPYADTLFIFVSDEPKEILPTIYSRLQRVEMRRFSDSAIAGILERECGVDRDAAIQIAALSEGNAAAAVEAAAASGELEGFMHTFQEMMRKAYGRQVRELRELSETVAAMGREKNMRFLAYCSRMVRENFIYNLQVPQLRGQNRAEEQFSSRFAPFVTAANAPGMMELFDTAAEDIGRNANAKIVLFDTMLQLIVLLVRR